MTHRLVWRLLALEHLEQVVHPGLDVLGLGLELPIRQDLKEENIGKKSKKYSLCVFVFKTSTVNFLCIGMTYIWSNLLFRDI